MSTEQIIAAAFSSGNFSSAFPRLTENCVWDITGEKLLQGRQAIINHCEATAAYFSSVTTRFSTAEIIAGHNRVVVTGTAEFLRGDERIAFVSACDVYTFNDAQQLEKISSYCVRHPL